MYKNIETKATSVREDKKFLCFFFLCFSFQGEKCKPPVHTETPQEMHQKWKRDVTFERDVMEPKKLQLPVRCFQTVLFVCSNVRWP